MSQAALERVKNLNDDDLFLSFDADEIPKAEVKTFLPVEHRSYNRDFQISSTF